MRKNCDIVNWILGMLGHIVDKQYETISTSESGNNVEGDYLWR